MPVDTGDTHLTTMTDMSVPATAARETHPTPQASDRPRLAVIIPFFNDMDKLERTVRSLVAQSLRPSLVVLVDDCGAERLAPSIAEALETAGIPLELVLNKANRGPGGSRQAGMDVLPADLEYLMFLDSDDFLSPNCLEALVEAHVREPGLAATYASSRNVHTGEMRLEAGRTAFDNLVDGMLLGPRGWGTGSLLWRYAQIRRVRWPSMRKIEDSHFELSAALLNPRIRHVPEAVIHIDQTWEPERLVRRNRHLAESDRQRLVELYQRILRNYPLYTDESRRKGYLHRAVYGWMRLTPLRGGAYLREALTYLPSGRWRVTALMLYYLPRTWRRQRS